MIKKAHSVKSSSLPEAPKADLAAATLESIARLKATAPREGVKIETHRLAIDKVKLESYRRLQQEFQEKLVKTFDIEGLRAIIAAAEDLRKPLIAINRRGRVPKEGD